MNGSKKTLINKTIFLFFTCVFLVSLCGCSEESETNANKSINEKNTVTAISTPPSETHATSKNSASISISPEKRDASEQKTAEFQFSPDMADKFMAFNNAALERLQTDWINPAENFYNLAHIYLRIYKIPADLNLPKRKRQDLLPQKGILPASEEQILFTAMDNMDKALASSNTHFNQLKKYILDAGIQDNGAQGKKITAMLEQDYKAFSKARKIWEDIVKQYAEKAEQALLSDHPLARQALAASGIMNIIVETNNYAKMSTVDRQELSKLCDKLKEFISEGSKPPFPSSPSLERLYRIFLKNASVFADVLNRSTLEGIYPIQKRELAIAGRSCSDTYNDFVKAFNETL